ncbi:MAG: hypothetical protein WKF90_02690 [Pyrinomonadaceae bacterium]
MRTIEHLTKEQLAAYAVHSPLAQIETDVIEKHLLQCAVCRDALPAPTPQQFWSALLDETEFDENFEAENVSPARALFPPVFAFFRQPLAWGTLALLFVAGVSLLIWLGASKKPNSKTEVAQTVETPKTENTLPTNEIPPVSTGAETGNRNSSEVNFQPQPRLKQSQSNLPAIAENSKKPEETENRELAQLIENTPPAVSSLRPNGQTTLRGNTQNSNPASPAFSLLAPVGETVLEGMPEFRWEKVPNAKSYRISILDQDFNEVLTTEVSGNSFKPGKALKTGAKYLWRVEAQTENGKIVAPLPPQPPAVFRIAPATTGSRIASLKKNETDRLKLAIFYASEGMLDAAACTLKEILAKNPKHKAAGRLLAQVERWKKENRATVQRCGPSTATKADQ